MGLFDFLKKKKPAVEPPDETPLEVAMRLALGDATYHKAFYQELLRSTLTAIKGPNVVPPGKTMLSAGDALQLMTLADGSIPVFSSARRILDGGPLRQEVHTIELEARVLLEITQGATLVLNPFSNHVKELMPDEIERLLDGRLFQSRQSIIVEQDIKIRLGQPAVYPTELVAAMQRLFRARPLVRRAYLVWCHIPGDGRPPHALIGLEVTADATLLFDEAWAIAQTVLPADEVVDFMLVNPATLGGPDEYIRTETKPFYEQEERGMISS